MIEILKLSIINGIYLLGTFVSFGLIFGWLESLNNKFLFQAFGRAGIVITGFIGTVVHETAHYLMCLIFGHKVTEAKFFRPFASSTDNVLGYVKHSYNKSSMYQRIGNFFIGIAPLIFGIIVILILLRILLPESFSLVKNNMTTIQYIKLNDNLKIGEILKCLLHDFFITIKYIFFSKKVTTLRYWIFVFSTYSIVTHMSLSKADLHGSLSGLVSIFIIILLVTIVAQIFGLNNALRSRLIQFNIFVACFMVIGIFFLSVTLGISFIISRIITPGVQ